MFEKLRQMNILVTLDENYVPYLNVMLSSLIDSNPGVFLNVYLLHRSVPETAVQSTRALLSGFGVLHMVCASNIHLDDAPTTSRYPQEIYYRIFAARYLPENIDRVLYLDPDLVVNGSLWDLYCTPMEDYYFAAASHTGVPLTVINRKRIDSVEEGPYINSGVMLMNLALLRREQRVEDVYSFIYRRKNFLILPDQDIISSLYASKIYALDAFRYNMSERLYQLHAPFERDLNIEWIRRHTVIIHYCGRNKPWKKTYFGQLDIFYKEALARMREKERLFIGEAQ